MRQALAGLLISATLLPGGCTSGGGQAATPISSPLSSPAPASPLASVLPGSDSSADPQSAVDAALADAAEHLGVGRADLHVDHVEARQWGDASLGCPKPGVMYLQVVTAGFLILITGAGKQLEYHSDARGRVVLCQEH